jgi:hypothetical protein
MARPSVNRERRVLRKFRKCLCEFSEAPDRQDRVFFVVVFHALTGTHLPLPASIACYSDWQPTTSDHVRSWHFSDLGRCLNHVRLQGANRTLSKPVQQTEVCWTHGNLLLKCSRESFARCSMVIRQSSSSIDTSQIAFARPDALRWDKSPVQAVIARKPQRHQRRGPMHRTRHSHQHRVEAG